MKKDSLGDRMKANYENISKTRLTRRTPVILRLDGKAFHTFTRGFEVPFDNALIMTMQQTMMLLCEEIMNVQLGYVQSDEISLLLCDYKRHSTQAWFDNEVEKMCSIAASMATLHFNKLFEINDSSVFQEVSIKQAHKRAMRKGAMFDCRCFNIPKEEVCNYFIWRQQDAARNSIQMVGHANFSVKQMHKKNTNDIQDMLFTECGINWNDYPTVYKRGSCCVKDDAGWHIDRNIPIFTQCRDYVEQHVYIEENE